MLYFPPQRPRRLTDREARAILSHSRLACTDTGREVPGRIIGWRRTRHRSLAAIVLNPASGARHLFAVCFRTGHPRHLYRMV
jgi:hypothetical protein